MAIVDSHNFFAKGRYLFIVFGSVSIPPPDFGFRRKQLLVHGFIYEGTHTFHS